MRQTQRRSVSAILAGLSLDHDKGWRQTNDTTEGRARERARERGGMKETERRYQDWQMNVVAHRRVVVVLKKDLRRIWAISDKKKNRLWAVPDFSAGSSANYSARRLLLASDGRCSERARWEVEKSGKLGRMSEKDRSTNLFFVEIGDKGTRNDESYRTSRPREEGFRVCRVVPKITASGKIKRCSHRRRITHWAIVQKRKWRKIDQTRLKILWVKKKHNIHFHNGRPVYDARQKRRTVMRAVAAERSSSKLFSRTNCLTDWLNATGVSLTWAAFPATFRWDVIPILSIPWKGGRNEEEGEPKGEQGEVRKEGRKKEKKRSRKEGRKERSKAEAARSKSQEASSMQREMRRENKKSRKIKRRTRTLR